MELNYFGSGLEELLNSSNITTEVMPDEETFKWTNAEIV